MVKNQPAKAGDMGLTPGSGKISWRRKWQTTLVFLLGESPQRWQAIVHGVTKSQARLSMHACEKGPIAFISCEPEKITQEFQNPITMKAVTVKPCKLAFWVKDNTKTLLLAAVGAKVCRKEHLPSLPRAAPPQIHLFISERTATPCGHFSVQRLAALVFHYLKNHQIGVFASHFPSSHCTGEQRKQL